MRKIVAALIACIVWAGTLSAQSQVASTQEDQLKTYLRSHWQSPEDYVVDKFKNHDIVFIGEFHRIKQNVELIHHLIPRLYKAGIYNLGIEFGCYEYQDKVDQLITADKYDEKLARWLMFKFLSDWGYKEYEDIYRKAWELNKSLAKGKPKFRVVNLGYRPYWPARQENMTRELWQAVWHEGDPDEYMAKIVLKEFVDKDQKALIYSGRHHAFTRYQQPIYDTQANKFIRFVTNRMGNVVYARIGNRAFNIVLHAPFYGRSYDQFIYPVDGIIDRTMTHFAEKRVGFDVAGTPFGALPDRNTFYAHGYTDFTLGTFCDGYIFQMQIKDYVPVTVDTRFVRDDNLQEAIDYISDPESRKSYKTPKDFIDRMRSDADLTRYTKDLK